jgi:hypothetical protein
VGQNRTLYPFGRRCGLFAAVACVSTVAALLSYDANAQNCGSFSNGCADQSVSVPCSNIVYCYLVPVGWNITCVNGAQITNYQNSSPPGSWSNCTQANWSPPRVCNDALQPCGTTLYFAGPCNAGNQCQISGGLGSVRWCEAPAIPVCP